MKNFKLVWSARSECGPNRKKNEDSIYPSTSVINNPLSRLLFATVLEDT